MKHGFDCPLSIGDTKLWWICGEANLRWALIFNNWSYWSGPSGVRLWRFASKIEGIGVLEWDIMLVRRIFSLLLFFCIVGKSLMGPWFWEYGRDSCWNPTRADSIWVHPGLLDKDFSGQFLDSSWNFGQHGLDIFPLPGGVGAWPAQPQQVS